MNNLLEVLGKVQARGTVEVQAVTGVMRGEDGTRKSVLHQEFGEIMGVSVGNGKNKLPAPNRAVVAEEGRNPCHTGDLNNLPGDHLLVPGVHQFIGGRKLVALDTNKCVAVEGVGIDAIPDKTHGTLMETLERPGLVTQVSLLQLRSPDLQPGPTGRPLQGQFPLPQAVAQYACYELR